MLFVGNLDFDRFSSPISSGVDNFRAGHGRDSLCFIANFIDIFV